MKNKRKKIGPRVSGGAAKEEVAVVVVKRRSVTSVSMSIRKMFSIEQKKEDFPDRKKRSNNRVRGGRKSDRGKYRV